MILTQQNQTLETNKLTNQTQNILNLNTPQTYQPYLLPNINNNPQNTQNFNVQYNPQNIQNFNPQFNPVFAPTFSPVFAPQISQPIEVERKEKTITNRTITGLVKLELEPKTISCPFCEEEINTKIKKSTNIKALLIAIGTLYIGFVLIQTCRGKAVSCKDCEHSCPNCGHLIGKYHAM